MIGQEPYHSCLCFPAVLVPKDAEGFLEGLLSLFEIRHLHFVEGPLLQPGACGEGSLLGQG